MFSGEENRGKKVGRRLVGGAREWSPGVFLFFVLVLYCFLEDVKDVKVGYGWWMVGRWMMDVPPFCCDNASTLLRSCLMGLGGRGRKLA